MTVGRKIQERDEQSDQEEVDGGRKPTRFN